MPSGFNNITKQYRGSRVKTRIITGNDDWIGDQTNVEGIGGWIGNPIMPAGVSPRFCVVDAGVVREMTDAEKTEKYPPPTPQQMARAELDQRDGGGKDTHVLEDVISLLIDKGVFTLADLPPGARGRLAEREALRAAAQGD